MESQQPADPSPSADPAGSADPLRVAARARLAAIVESSDDAIVSKTLEGVIQSWNRGAERIFGWKAEEVIGQPITIIIPEDRLEEEPEILRRIGRGERVDHFETNRKTRDGRLINVSVTISPVRDDSGRIVGASKVARDITAQKTYEQELRAARDAAETANRAKDHFLSVLSHELRTPLTPVLASINLLQRSSDIPAEFRDALEMMRRNVETEARLVDDLLDLTRIARGKLRLHPEVLDAHAVLRDIVQMFHREIDEKGLSVTVSLRARQFHVWADPGRFQQILLNLLSNAVKFTPADGTITVRTANENGTIRIEVIDTGIGIEPEVLPRLFRPFEQGEQTVSRRFGGLGLGLSIVKSLAELHKASISVSSEGRDKGATFMLRMDTVSPAAQHDASSRANLTPPQQRFHVLLVEDHADTRSMLSKLLTSFGCIVTAASSVKEAVDAAEKQSFDLLLSDIGLPDGSGIDVMKHMARYNVRGIALSGFGRDEDLRRSREAGFEQHLTKPINVQALQAVIRKVVR